MINTGANITYHFGEVIMINIPKCLCFLIYWLRPTVTNWMRPWQSLHVSWWRHQMESFSALQAICAGNSSITGEFPAQKACDAELWSFISAWMNGWVNNRKAGDLKRRRAHHDVIVMFSITPNYIQIESRACVIVSLRINLWDVINHPHLIFNDFADPPLYCANFISMSQLKCGLLKLYDHIDLCQHGFS